MRDVLIFLGETGSRKIEAELSQRGWGRMWVEKAPDPEPGEPWAFDNGAFLDYQRGRAFDGEAFWRRLDRAKRKDLPAPVFAVTPDVVGGGLASLEFSIGWRERLGDDGWPWYLAVQDGMMPPDVAPVIDAFDGLFLGGTTRFKSTAEAWRQLSHDFKCPLHYGRASTPERVRSARALGVDSLDSSFPLWRRDRLAEFIEACEGTFRQQALWPTAAFNLIGDGY